MRLSRGLVYTVLLVGVVLHLFPFLFIISLSLQSPQDAQSFPPQIIPTEPNLSAWRLMWDLATSAQVEPQFNFIREPFWRYFLNSVLIAVVTLGLSLPICALAAYANSKLQRTRGRRFTFLFFIGTLMVPFAVVLVPSFLLVRNFPFALPKPPTVPGTGSAFPTLSLFDTPWAVILPAVFVPFSFLLFKGFFDTIPDSVIQAARVDGGSEFNIFRRIVFPMSVPVFAVAAFTSFSSVWENFIWQILVLQSPKNSTTSVAIYGLLNSFIRSGAQSPAEASAQSQVIEQVQAAGLTWNGLMVLGLLQTLPIFVTFLICRRYLLSGVRIRGLK
jgi:ABC-type glycerol-3-phosphate transport system permease component